MNYELALFAGAGGGVLGSHLAGWRTVAAVEIDAYCRDRLLQRQDEGHLPAFPIWDDVRTFDGRPFRGLVDLISAGFPCQPFSQAGKRRGKDDERNLWPETARVIREVGPSFVLLENTVGIAGYLPEIHRELQTMAFCCLPPIYATAAGVGAGHIRRRVFLLAHALGVELREQPGRCIWEGWEMAEEPERSLWWADEPGMARVVHGLSHRVDRQRAVGNAQVPAVVLRVLEEAGLIPDEATTAKG